MLLQMELEKNECRSVEDLFAGMLRKFEGFGLYFLINKYNAYTWSLEALRLFLFSLSPFEPSPLVSTHKHA